MDRRAYISTVSGGVTVLLAGCLGGTDDAPSERDSDSDGVVDADDYAPHDPAVQSRSDIEEATTTPAKRTASPDTTATATAGTSETGTARTPSSVQSVDTAAKISADNDALDTETSYLLEYDARAARARLVPFDLARQQADRIRVWLITVTYPLDDIVSWGYSDPIDVDDSGSIDVPVPHRNTPSDGLESGEYYHHVLLSAPAEYTDFANIPGSTIDKLAESKRFSVTQDGSIAPDPHPVATVVGDVDADRYVRTDIEGGFMVTVTGTTAETDWETTTLLYKSVYVGQYSRGDQPDHEGYAAAAMDGAGSFVANHLAATADEAGLSASDVRIGMAHDFVQALPDRPDSVGSGYEDETKYAFETFIEGGGDTDDLAVLLASIL